MAERVAASQSFSTKSLYELSVLAVSNKFITFKSQLNNLPEKILFDVYYQVVSWFFSRNVKFIKKDDESENNYKECTEELCKEKRLCLIGMEFSDIHTFSQMLKVVNRRIHLLQIFQALMDHGMRVCNGLAIGYNVCCFSVTENGNTREKIANLINLGLKLGGFLSEAGWYSESEKVLMACKNLCISEPENFANWCLTLECCHKLLHAQAAYCAFRAAADTYQLAIQTIEKLQNAGHTEVNHAALYAEFSVLFFIRSEYDRAYTWSIEALKQLKPSLPARIKIDVLRQVAKSCVVKREFQKAGLLIKQAVYLAREVFQTDHPIYSDVLIDYGFYLLNYDSINNSVLVYKFALELRESIFGKTNLLVATAHEDMAYALYVHEYSSGKFEQASIHAGEAIKIMDKLLPVEHLMLASAKRVKALILEEIALENIGAPLSEQDLLLKSECLHLSALQLAKTAFGEKNVQTAKHYGNLGRLYQSMRRFQEAEMMHLKAISIKEEILGMEDYEVGLSIGHLASLYNFHMNRYRDAEKLYYRSIEISLKLFGLSYSGLEYDYRGLMHLYQKLEEQDKVFEYTNYLAEWRNLRDRHVESEDPPIDLHTSPQPIEDITRAFFSMR